MILRQCLFCTRHTPRPSQLCNKILYKTHEYRYCSRNNNFGWLWFQFFKKRGTKGCVPIIVVSYCLALYVWKFTPESRKWGFKELLNLRAMRVPSWPWNSWPAIYPHGPVGGGGHGRLLTMVYRGSLPGLPLVLDPFCNIMDRISRLSHCQEFWDPQNLISAFFFAGDVVLGFGSIGLWPPAGTGAICSQVWSKQDGSPNLRV